MKMVVHVRMPGRKQKHKEETGDEQVENQNKRETI